jgi:anti-sigma factor RsiW
MDRQSAKQILACYRPGRDDPADPAFGEALEQARRDPELAHWLAQQTAFDAVVSETLRDLPVPANLRKQILAHVSAPPIARVWWRQPAFRAAAVALVALAVMAGVWLANQPDTFDAYRQQMAALVSGDYDMKIKSTDLKEIRQYLASQGWPSDYALTPAMQRLEAEGGSVIKWHGKKISLVCVQAGDDKDLFLFVVPRSVLPGAPATEIPQFASVGGMMTAAWSVGDQLYLLASHADEKLLRRYL